MRFAHIPLRGDAKVCDELQRWWTSVQAFNHDGDDNLSYDEYVAFYMRLVWAFNNDEADDNDISKEEVDAHAYWLADWQTGRLTDLPTVWLTAPV